MILFGFPWSHSCMLIEVVPHLHTALQKFMWLQVIPPNRRLCLENNHLHVPGWQKKLQVPVSEVILFWLRPWRACHNHVFQAAEDDRARVFRRWIARSQVLEFPVGLDDTSGGCYTCYMLNFFWKNIPDGLQVGLFGRYLCSQLLPSLFGSFQRAGWRTSSQIPMTPYPTRVVGGEAVAVGEFQDDHWKIT